MSSVINGAAIAVQNIEVLQGMDIETAMLAVQYNRAELIEMQLRDQIRVVQRRNQKSAKLNEVLAALNAVQAQFKSDAKPSEAVGEKGKNQINAVSNAVKSAGMTDFGGFSENSTKADLDGAITKLKAQVDTIGNTQQMDLLRLQTLHNRRNEAIDLASMTIKKHADKNEAIIGNMR